MPLLGTEARRAAGNGRHFTTKRCLTTGTAKERAGLACHSSGSESKLAKPLSDATGHPKSLFDFGISDSVNKRKASRIALLSTVSMLDTVEVRKRLFTKP